MRSLALLLLAGCTFSPRGAVGARCADGIRNDDETDVDCGGSCVPCAVGMECTVAADCEAAVCDAGACRLAAHCRELHGAQPTLGDRSYTLDPDGATGAAPFTTFCDMTVDGGGWTLIGKVDGEQEMHATWLISAVDAAALENPAIGTSAYACLDAVHLAVTSSAEVRLSNSTGSAWIKWPLPAGRTEATWWRHAVGWTTVAAADQTAVTVTTSDGATAACFQNVFGILPHPSHGGGYPFAARDAGGSTVGGDNCMAVGVVLSTTTRNGFDQNGNGFDAPTDETTWPNPAYHVTPHVAVWLR